MCLSLLLLTIDSQSNQFQFLKTTVNYISWPVMQIAQLPVQGAQFVKRHVATRDMLQRQNQRLREDNLFLAAQLQRVIGLEQENQQLRALLNTAQTTAEMFLSAAMIAQVPDPLSHEIVINKGTRHGVKVGLAVLNSSGLIGQTVAVTATTSRVLLLHDRRSAVPVELARNGVRAIALGKGNRKRLYLENVPNTVDVQVGDTCLTSGLGGHFPIGYPVGQILRVTKRPDARFAEIEIIPAAELNRTREVLVLINNEKFMASHTAQSSENGTVE